MKPEATPIQEEIPARVLEQAKAFEINGWKIANINPPEVDQEFIEEGLKGARELFGTENVCTAQVRDTNGKVYTVFLDKEGKKDRTGLWLPLHL